MCTHNFSTDTYSTYNTVPDTFAPRPTNIFRTGTALLKYDFLDPADTPDVAYYSLPPVFRENDTVVGVSYAYYAYNSRDIGPGTLTREIHRTETLTAGVEDFVWAMRIRLPTPSSRDIARILFEINTVWPDSNNDTQVANAVKVRRCQYVDS